jgi:hypothetical protein
MDTPSEIWPVHSNEKRKASMALTTFKIALRESESWHPNLE